MSSALSPTFTSFGSAFFFGRPLVLMLGIISRTYLNEAAKTKLLNERTS